MQNTARLTLANTASIRQLRGIAIRTVLLPSKSTLVLSAKDATQKWATNRDPQKGPPYVEVFRAILQTAIGHPSIDAIDRDFLIKLASTVRTEDVLSSVKTCRMSKTFKPEISRFELSTVNLFTKAADILIRLAVADGGHECYGQAPRTPLERDLQQAVHLT